MLRLHACHCCSALAGSRCAHGRDADSGIRMQGLGYAISLAGFFLYNYIKMQKGPAPRSARIFFLFDGKIKLFL